MGFTILSDYTTKSGLTLQNAYVNIANNMIYCIRLTDMLTQVTKYHYHCVFNVYVSKMTKTHKPFLEQVYHEVNLDENTLDPYKVMYNDYKSLFNNVIDE